jgi:transcriptional regulator with XRE-family HTH domain
MKTYEKIKEIRELNNFTIEDIAKVLSITPEKMSRIEEGKDLADIKIISILAKHYNVKIGELFSIF